MKKIFLPVDHSIHSTQAIEYVGMMAPLLAEPGFSLFHVQPLISDFIMEEAGKDATAMAKLKQLNQKNETEAYAILNRHKERLVQLGVPAETISVSTQRRKEGVARDIIEKARQEAADVIAMGRRGFSKFQDIFIGSATKNVVDHTVDTPVWVIDGEFASKNLLLAVDGSTDSVKALGHVLDVLRNNPDVAMTLFHVQPSLTDSCAIDFTSEIEPEDEEAVIHIIEKANRMCIDNFTVHVRRKLEEKAIPEDRLELKTRPARRNVGAAIVEEFKSGDYGTVIVGKRGIGKRFFMGSVSSYLVTHLTNGALWIVP
ncbi:MAG: universal stress protein [Thermodesulfobacteriota bacterium]